MRLEERDRQVLSETFLSKIVRRDDLLRLGLFGSVPRCNARLLSLNRCGLLARRNDITGCDLRSPLYLCTAKGVRIAADSIGFSQAEAIETHRRGLTDLSIRHALKCLDLRLQFVRECLDSPYRMIRWASELLCRHDFFLPNGASISMKPDAMVELTNGDRSCLAFIEVDLGNVSIPRFSDKVGRYITYRDSKAFAEVYQADSFVVLTVTSNESRLMNLCSTTDRSNFYFSTWKRLSNGIFGPECWCNTAVRNLDLSAAIKREMK